MIPQKFTESLNGDKGLIFESIESDNPYVRGYTIMLLATAAAYDRDIIEAVKKHTEDDGYYALGNTVADMASAYIASIPTV